MNEEKNNISEQTEEIKKETVETAKKVRETVQNVNFKDETKNTKKFVIRMFKEPLQTIKELATDNQNKEFKTALIILIIWIISIFIDVAFSKIYYGGLYRVWTNILSILKSILAPLCIVVIYSLIALVMNKNKRKSLVTNITTLSICQLPVVIASVISLLTIFSYRISSVTVPINYFAKVLSAVLTYFGLKMLFEEENDEEFIKKYVIIQVIYFVCYIIIALLGIKIY